MENESTPSHAIEQTAKPKVGVTFRVDQSDLDKFKRICAARNLSQAKQFVQWIRKAELDDTTAYYNSTNDGAI